MWRPPLSVAPSKPSTPTNSSAGSPPPYGHHHLAAYHPAHLRRPMLQNVQGNNSFPAPIHSAPPASGVFSPPPNPFGPQTWRSHR
ncbi:hypothetical protein GLOTRDRAFT_57655 [Gloeophyllum trabeum ATCC 11539]|uniref:Uncharacterized protein n=1 Tax=Gloeophyllum trabeum (strain ATCC 11539 / FP-39264 / Madison 617) TaxID=670483 RepID=S7QH55_GLOTA|nr:uncharacterized protein GLOTRDRAFT_57655 [Gloeophyllum trabeum ATCC 11539]EPQ58578.1 hypothetical protein GLOTRDRAFT_57655 [Gloeophyllum trabeum ATCC 11539]